jgi:rubrerythrin
MTHHEVMKDKDYNLVSTLYHALQGAETSGTYLRDAEQQGDEEVAKYFRDIQGQYTQVAEKAKDLLGKRLK